MTAQSLRKLRPLWRLKKLKLYQMFQENFDIVTFVKLPGINFQIAILLLRDLTWLIRSFGIRTNVESGQVENLFDKVMTTIQPAVFWDVGANIGLYSWKALSTPRIQEVVLFEADRKNYDLIQKTICRNNLFKAKVNHAAVSNFSGTVDFLVDNVSGATGCIKSNHVVASSESLHQDYNLSKVVSVPAITLDSLITSNFSPPDVIKIDVEGAEGLVIEGALNVIKDFTPLLIVETGDQQLIDDLKHLDYQTISLDKNNVVFIPKKYCSLLEDGSLLEAVFLKNL